MLQLLAGPHNGAGGGGGRLGRRGAPAFLSCTEGTGGFTPVGQEAIRHKTGTEIVSKLHPVCKFLCVHSTQTAERVTCSNTWHMSESQW